MKINTFELEKITSLSKYFLRNEENSFQVTFKK